MSVCVLGVFCGKVKFTIGKFAHSLHHRAKCTSEHSYIHSYNNTTMHTFFLSLTLLHTNVLTMQPEADAGLQKKKTRSIFDTSQKVTCSLFLEK